MKAPLMNERNGPGGYKGRVVNLVRKEKRQEEFWH